MLDNLNNFILVTLRLRQLLNLNSRCLNVFLKPVLFINAGCWLVFLFIFKKIEHFFFYKDNGFLERKENQNMNFMSVLKWFEIRTLEIAGTDSYARKLSSFFHFPMQDLKNKKVKVSQFSWFSLKSGLKKLDDQ